ncbi:hypothetical protein LHP98_07175 [Rhodobacter sp. Har01]|uniref:hypothetical protein n=1 Tax=Rhodobacter sp. Har01 TaxID=2883999 RepID=UPI001D08BFA1|nr:hypothetical protein [Rhodobacter sp. Har01]MCB6177910.1 hypothetical protein [Rhodobacter sp. Har01]
MTAEDLRAAVAAGIVDEAQAAKLRVLVEARAGHRQAMPSEDEPFEFFRGFSEIFISIGLVILLTGVTMMLAWFGGFGLLVAVPLITAGIAWWWAGYFTLRRRMTLPSMVLATAFGVGLAIFAVTVLEQMDVGARMAGVLAFALPSAGMVLWYRRFRLPFAAFLTGGFVLGAIYAFTASTANLTGMMSGASGFDGLFDLRESPAFATATLVFGIGAFLVGMWFDTRDPHRLGRHAATAFWCHLLAAPALVNTVAVTLLNSGGGQGIGMLSLALVVITILALVIDRRSFLTAAIVYIAVVISWFAGDAQDFGSWIFILIALGALITGIGTWWVQLRAFVMKVLPNFPGKDRLPPYARPE